MKAILHGTAQGLIFKTFFHFPIFLNSASPVPIIVFVWFLCNLILGYMFTLRDLTVLTWRFFPVQRTVYPISPQWIISFDEVTWALNQVGALCVFGMYVCMYVCMYVFGLWTTNIYFSQFWRLVRPKPKHRQIWYLGRALSLVHRYLLIVSSHGLGGRVLSLSF